jgi:hypothetical protein
VLRAGVPPALPFPFATEVPEVAEPFIPPIFPILLFTGGRPPDPGVLAFLGVLPVDPIMLLLLLLVSPNPAFGVADDLPPFCHLSLDENPEKDADCRKVLGITTVAALESGGLIPSRLLIMVGVLTRDGERRWWPRVDDVVVASVGAGVEGWVRGCHESFPARTFRLDLTPAPDDDPGVGEVVIGINVSVAGISATGFWCGWIRLLDVFALEALVESTVVVTTQELLRRYWCVLVASGDRSAETTFVTSSSSLRRRSGDDALRVTGRDDDDPFAPGSTSTFRSSSSSTFTDVFEEVVTSPLESDTAAGPYASFLGDDSFENRRREYIDPFFLTN